MSIRLLHGLASQALPVTVTGADEVDKVHILVMAGHVRASFAPVASSTAAATGARPTAVITEITRLGRIAIRGFPPPPDDA